MPHRGVSSCPLPVRTKSKHPYREAHYGKPPASSLLAYGKWICFHCATLVPSSRPCRVCKASRVARVMTNGREADMAMEEGMPPPRATPTHTDLTAGLGLPRNTLRHASKVSLFPSSTLHTGASHLSAVVQSSHYGEHTFFVIIH